MSTISASTTSTTAFKITTDTTGTLVFQTGASPTTAVTFDGSQNLGVGITNPAGYGVIVGYKASGTASYIVGVNGGGCQTAIGVAGDNESLLGTLTNNALRICTNGLERARIDTSGNFGLGVTPSAWSSTSRAFQWGTNSILENNNGGATYIGFNGYRSATGWKYLTSSYAHLYGMENDGAYKWYNAASGTAGNAITFTQAMTLNASGNLGVGVTSIASDAKVHIGGALRAGSTTYNASPASTLFSNTLAAASGNTRVVNFDGNGSAPSVWWTNGSRAYSAVDADGTNNLAFWANNGTTWQKQVNVNYGSVDLLTTVNATGGVMTVSNPTGTSYNENLRLPRAGGVNYTTVAMACDPASSTGAIDGQFTFLVYPSSASNGQFSIRSFNTDVLVIQKTGYITTPLNPAFQAQGVPAATLGTGWQKIAYTQSVTQRGTAYASSRFTAPIAGWYQFNAQWSAESNADVDGTFSFAVNGDVGLNKGSVSMANTGPDYDGHSLAATIYLALNDYVEVYRYSTAGTTTRSNYWQGWFSGHLIG